MDRTHVSYYFRGFVVWPALRIFKCRYRIATASRSISHRHRLKRTLRAVTDALGLQPAATKRIGTAARGKAVVMPQRPWQAGLQLEVAKRIATAAVRKKNGPAEAAKQVAGRQLRAEAEQRGSSPDKRLPREKVAEPRSTSAKSSLSEKVTQKRNDHPSIHSIIHPFIDSFSR